MLLLNIARFTRIAGGTASLFTLVGLLVTGSVARAQPPTSQVLAFTGTMPGQGDGPVAIRLRLYNVQTGGAPQFEETQTVMVTSETFTVRIGDATAGGVPATLFRNTPSLWIAFAFEATPDSQIGLRAAITSSGYAHAAAVLSGPLELTAGDGVTISGTNENGRGVQGISTREVGVFGVSETSAGVSGISNSGVAGDIAGVQGIAFGTGGKGVFGLAGFGPDGTGVVGRSTSGGRGLYGETNAAWPDSLGGRAGVVGVSTGVSGIGVFGQADNSVAFFKAIGLYGRSTTGWAAYFDGLVAIPALAAPGITQLCRTESPNSRALGSCTSSLRYKTDVGPFTRGLDIVNRLRPIAFTWKQGHMRDVGLAAEDVEEVEPLLTFRNDQGEIEGVRYNQLSAVFVNAFAEQQAQIHRQQDQIAQQQHDLTALKALVCSSHLDADVCR